MPRAIKTKVHKRIQMEALYKKYGQRFYINETVVGKVVCRGCTPLNLLEFIDTHPQTTFANLVWAGGVQPMEEAWRERL